MSSTPDSTFVLAVAVWATLQLTWTVILLIGQFWQIMRQLTTFEVSNIGRFGFMGGKGSSMAMQQGHWSQQATVGFEDDTGSGNPAPAGGNAHTGHRHGAHGHAHGRKQKHSHGISGCFGFILRLLGLDRFTKGKAADGLLKSSGAKNPFDLGLIGNCVDFWTKGREVGVQYESVYTVPQEGFKAAKAHREMRDDEDTGSLMSGMGSGGKRRLSMGVGGASKFIPSWLVGMRRGERNPYQSINMSEEV